MHPRNTLCLYLCAIGAILAGCGTKPIQPSDKHIQRQSGQPEPTTSIPQPIKHSIALPPPKPVVKAETYSVVVTNVPAQEILFALARDAKINLDIHPGIQGTVTLNAIDQTLPQILTRIAKQVDMRYMLENGTLTVMPDTPYLHNYKIDYVNMTRDAEGGISNTTQVGSAASGSAGAPSGGVGGANNSQLTVKNTSRNDFWKTLIQNIKDILHETDKILPSGSSETVVQQVSSASSTGTGVQPATSKKPVPKGGIENSPNPVNVQEGGTTVTRTSTFREAASVIANPENGIITVRATGKQHEKIQEFIDNVMTSARRQVLIEATVVEVQLNDQYQQGINWSGLRLGSRGLNLKQAATQAASGGLFAPVIGKMLDLDYNNPTSNGTFSAQISLLESFGKVKVLSSPKLSVMNNQTAVLRVVNNLVYFSITVTPGTINSVTGAPATPPTYSSTPQTVPVGFTMSVTPQIGDSDSVQINLRPTVTRLVRYVNDPNPDLATAKVTNQVPETQTREIESVLKIENNQIAVLGGLMQDEINNLTDEVPGLSNIRMIGNLFKNRNDKTQKTELVIFLRPVVIKDASINGDFSAYSNMLPDQNFFKEPAGGKP